jgi:hypothetical protein
MVMEAANNGEKSLEMLIQIGRRALLQTPTMWRDKRADET